MNKLAITCLTITLVCCGPVKDVYLSSPNNEVLVKINRSQTVDNIRYLYGTYENQKIKIATFSKDKYVRNKEYLFKLYSLRTLLIDHRMMVVNYLHIDYSKLTVQLSDTIVIPFTHKSYSDLFITDDVRATFIKEIPIRDFFVDTIWNVEYNVDLIPKKTTKR